MNGIKDDIKDIKITLKEISEDFHGSKDEVGIFENLRAINLSLKDVLISVNKNSETITENAIMSNYNNQKIRNLYLKNGICPDDDKLKLSEVDVRIANLFLIILAYKKSIFLLLFIIAFFFFPEKLEAIKEILPFIK